MESGTEPVADGRVAAHPGCAAVPGRTELATRPSWTPPFPPPDGASDREELPTVVTITVFRLISYLRSHFNASRLLRGDSR